MQKKDSALSLIIVTITFTVSMGMVMPMVPLYASSLGADEVTVGLIVAVAPLSALFCDIPIGACSPYIGLERMLKLSFLIGAISGIIFMFVTSPVMFILPQIGFGLTLGLFMPQLINYYYRISSPDTREVMQGRNTAFQGVGFLIGPSLGGVIGQYFSLPSVFAAYAILSFFGYITCKFLRPLKRHELPEPLYKMPLLSFRMAFKFAKAQGEIRTAFLFVFLMVVLWQALGNTVFPLYIEQSFPGIPLMAGLLLTFREVGAITIRFLFARISRYFSLPVILSLSIILMALGSFMIPLFKHPLAIAMAVMVVGIGLGATFPSINLLAIGSTDETKGPLAMATCNVFSRIGLLTAAPVLGVMTKACGFQSTFQVTSIAAVIVVFGFLLRHKISVRQQKTSLHIK